MRVPSHHRPSLSFFLSSSRRHLFRAANLIPALAALAFACGEPSAQLATDGGLDPGTCVGVKPPMTAWATAPRMREPLPDGGAECPTCIGAAAPAWQLGDFQTKSCGFGGTYGLEVFRGKVVLLALWAGW